MSAEPTTAAATAPTEDPIVRHLHEAIGLRPGALSQVRLRHATTAIADLAGVDAEQLAGRLRVDSVSRRELVDHVTVQESQFFRDDPFFAALRDEILPSLPDPLTVWSAGCAHGQEAFSVAMLLHEAGRSGYRILATDVSERALRTAAEASFAPRQLRGLSDGRRRRFLTERGDGRLEIAAELRAAVEFSVHNLVASPSPAGALDAGLVLLRNVLIYFDDRLARALLGRLAAGLAPGAWIVLGGSEVLHRLPGLEIVQVGSIYGYRVTRGGDRAPSAPDRPRSRGVPQAPGSVRATATARLTRPVGPAPDAAQRRVDGERHAAAGDHHDAVRCFRHAVYLDGDDVAARLGLALSLEASGDAPAAARAFRAARTALHRSAQEVVGEHRAEDLIDLVGERLTALERT